MDVMNMGNVVPRAGIEPEFLAFRGQCANQYTTRLPDVTMVLALGISADHYSIFSYPMQ